MQEITDTNLTLSRVFKTTPEKLWEIWTNPKHIDKWHKAGPGQTTVSTFEPHIGGNYSIKMTDSGQTYTVGGTIKEFDPPKKLVYSWEWANTPAGQSSEVQVMFEPVSGGTKLTVIHKRLANKESVTLHLQGWLNCMQNITSVIK